MKTGNQKPTFSVIGDYAYSDSREVVAMFTEDAGGTFYPCQKLELDLMLARNEDGAPSALTIGISKPRQNGKSYAARYYAMYMSDFEHRDVLYSAHHSTTTNKMFKALCNIFESPEKYPEFASDVKYISHVRGYEGIYFNDGGCIEFATRTNSGARGGTYSVIIIDEAQELTTDQQDAMLPVMSAASDLSDASSTPQVIYVGTPPSPSCKGTVFAEMRETAHAAGKSGAWWLEWSIESRDIVKDIPNVETALELAYKTNPAMGYRISDKVIVNEFETMSLDGFARERLGWWTPSPRRSVEYAISHEVWDACVSDELKPEGKTAYGIKFTFDGSMVCLCGAVIDASGNARISMIEQKPTGQGTRWLAEWLNERYNVASCVVIDGRNGADVLVDKISDTWKVKGSVIRPTARDIIASVSNLVDCLNENTVTWYRGQDALRESAITSVKRPIGGGWGFGGEYSAPIEACALALYGAKTSKRNPSRGMRIG